jgi:hypothetical protein
VPRPPADPRPQWERDDEVAEWKLTRADRALLRAGPAAAVRSGALAGVALGPVPWALTLLLRAALHGGWHLDHWVVNLTIYAALSVAAGTAMGALRHWSCLGHRFHAVPLAGVRAGWDTWLGIVAIDTFVVVAVLEDGLGALLLIAVWGLLWLGLLYSLVWAALQDLVLALGWAGRATAPGAAPPA